MIPVFVFSTSFSGRKRSQKSLHSFLPVLLLKEDVLRLYG